MTKYIKDLIELPDHVRRGDFVLRLSEGIIHPEETLKSYVVTPQLITCFDEALSLIQSALEKRSSKAAYLHGSFGSGKSHFMAILHLLLQGNPQARSVVELANVVEKHNTWTQSRKFLVVPYHMIGKEDMESAILGGYADYIRTIHPNAPAPGVYRADAIFKDARNLRQTMGDQAFFSKLNQEKSSESSEWGDIGTGWDAVRFEETLNAPPRSEDRSRLIGELVETFFQAARVTAEFVELDDGLSILSKHAKSMGYEAVILFLDELILWLASRAADVAFVNREGPKLAKLVEAQTADRPIPIISFVARQRDLRELIDDNVTGAESLRFSDTLRWWEDRFATIQFEDSNLPAIAEKRVLKPKSEDAREQITKAFEETCKMGKQTLDVLLTTTSDRASFRKIYPFSPAFMETLVAMSFLLQRERTALKVMLHILVEQRDRLKLGDVVPVGDLFDAVCEGDQAVSSEIKRQFDNAKQLYEEKLRPILERTHGLSFNTLDKAGSDDSDAQALRNDDRLIKTLLMAALAPKVEPLRGLTSNSLAALNHGTIKTPIPGREGHLVLSKCRKWAAEIGQIKIGDEPTNPAIAIHLTGVDVESIIDQARSEDNKGNRMRKIKELMFQQLGVKERDELFLRHPFVWRGTKRTCDIFFGNVREVPDDSLKGGDETWKIVIDWPFDEESYGPSDDIAKIQAYRENHPEGTRTLILLPSFLSRQAKRELGTLVILDYVMTGERLERYASHLSQTDRITAKSLLNNQRSQLRQRMITYLEIAYGIREPVQGTLDPAYELEPSRHLHSLEYGFEPRPPVGANLQKVFERLLDQSLQHQFPAHPLFDDNVKLTPAVLKRVYAELEKAAQIRGGRLPVDSPKRKELRQIANPLRLGSMEETHFLLGEHWKLHFMKKEAEHGLPLTVGNLRDWMEEPRPMGLPRELQNLVIMVFAAQTSCSFFLRNVSFQPSAENIPDETELRSVGLPSETAWKAARERAKVIFRVTASELLNGNNLGKFAADIREATSPHQESCESLCSLLTQRLPDFCENWKESFRYKTAAASLDFVRGITDSTRDMDLVEWIEKWESTSPDIAIGSNIRKASGLVKGLSAVKWQILERAVTLGGNHKTRAEALRQEIQTVLEKDEYAVALMPVLSKIEDDAIRLTHSALEQQTPEPQKTEKAEKPPAPDTAKDIRKDKEKPEKTYKLLGNGQKVANNKQRLDQAFKEIRKQMKANPGASIRLSWEIYTEK